MYAAQLFHSVREALPSLSNDIAEGNLNPLFHWLKQNIWHHGSRFSTDALITKATGEALNPRYFRQHLENRYL
ncbi:putative metalloprotease YpwA [compost metagenome]